MGLGGGTFISQNKVLPGAYINVVSASSVSATLSERGIAAMAIELDWGVDDAVFSVTAGDFQTNALAIFGYAYDNDKLKGLRDLFINAKECLVYKLMNGGAKASNTYCDAKYKGVRGNDIKIVVAANVDDGTKMDVSTYIGTTIVDIQTVAPNTDNLQDNDYVTWKSNVTLTATAGLSLTSGSNGSAITGTQHQSFLNAIESYSYNVLGCLSTTESIIGLYSAFAKRMRDDLGVKIQAVVYDTAADYEGVISVKNTVSDAGALASSLVYWTTGAAAGCAVNESLTNNVYGGEFTVAAAYTQAELESFIEGGYFAFHNVGDKVRVLTDINSFVSTAANKSSDFSSNQTIRVIDQVANDIAELFNTKYLGSIPNDNAGRISFWADIVAHHEQLENIRAIEDFDPDDVTVEVGQTKKGVVVGDAIEPVNAMEKLYMTVVVQ